MARFSVETETTKPESAQSRFTVEDEPAPSDSRFQVEETNSQDYEFPAGSPSARTPMIYKDKPSFEEAFPASTDKSSALRKSEGLANTIVGSVVKPIEWASEKYEEYVGGPIRRTMFKEDPLVTLDRQHRERQAVLEATGASEGQKTLETAKHLGKSLVASVLADPLSGLMGKRVFSQGEKAIVDPGANAGVWQGPVFQKQEWQGPPVQVWQGPEKQGTSVDLSTLSKPKPTSPLPTITELADESRYAPGTGPAGAFSDEMLEKEMLRSPESRAEKSTGLASLDRERTPYSKEFTAEFEKPGFLRTAEEKVQDKNALRTAEESVQANKPKQARDFERTDRKSTRLNSSHIQARSRTKERLAAEREEMIKEREAAQAEVPAHKQQWQGPYEEWQAGGFQGPRAPNRYWTPDQAGFSRDVDGNVTISDGSFPKPWQRFVARSLDTLGGSG